MLYCLVWTILLSSREDLLHAQISNILMFMNRSDLYKTRLTEWKRLYRLKNNSFQSRNSTLSSLRIISHMMTKTYRTMCTSSFTPSSIHGPPAHQPSGFTLPGSHWCHAHAHAHTHTHSAPGQISSLAAGALAAVDDGQDHGLTLPTGTLQAEETHRSVRVQTIAAALAHRLEVRLL